MYNVPATVEEMLPPTKSSIYNEAQNFLRAHWPEVKTYYEVLSGTKPSLHGAADLDEASCVFEVQKIAAANGYAHLSVISTHLLRKALRVGYKRNTGHPVRALIKQRRQLQIEAPDEE